MSSLRSENVQLHRHTVNREARAKLAGQQPSVLWFTGLSGSGKSTIANLVEIELHAQGRLTYMLDGDNVRHGLCGDLGFSDEDRIENIRRIAEVTQLMLDAGLIVLVAFISPFRSDRDRARAAFTPGEFFEIHISTPLAVVEERDPKGLYKRARRGEVKNFTGIDSAYEAPENPELRLDTTVLSAAEAAEQIVSSLAAAGRLSATTQEPDASQ